MKTTGIKCEESDTGTSFHDREKMVPSGIVDSKVRMEDTVAGSPKKGQAVPSSSLEGKVWLSYIPRERRIEKSESLTQK